MRQGTSASSRKSSQEMHRGERLSFEVGHLEIVAHEVVLLASPHRRCRGRRGRTPAGRRAGRRSFSSRSQFFERLRRNLAGVTCLSVSNVASSSAYKPLAPSLKQFRPPPRRRPRERPSGWISGSPYWLMPRATMYSFGGWPAARSDPLDDARRRRRPWGRRCRPSPGSGSSDPGQGNVPLVDQLLAAFDVALAEQLLACAGHAVGEDPGPGPACDSAGTSMRAFTWVGRLAARFVPAAGDRISTRGVAAICCGSDLVQRRPAA